ncbi:DUF4349 domain-containing protein [Actinocorallia libanotica]|uniref:DUF4349 domain-containing protein n=1 Tax=Actinocorallia libanotica TaxID=46162 RepID=A0ABN1QD90_9ACTN
MRKALCAVAALLVLTGCSSSTDQSTSLQADAPRAAAPEGSAYQAEPSARESSAPSAADRETGDTGTEQRAIAYTADLRVRVEKVEPATVKAKELVDAAKGYVARERTYGTTPSARLDFQVPAERYPEVLDALAKQLGEKVSLEQSAEDVTEEIADVDSRVESAEAALKRLRTLLSRAGTVGEVLQVSEELDQRQADLDALKARQKSLSKRVKEAAITLVVVSEKEEPAEEDDSGFLGGLKAGWSDFTGFVSGLLTGVGWLLPFSPFLVGLFFLGRFLIRRRARRRGQAA